MKMEKQILTTALQVATGVAREAGAYQIAQAKLGITYELKGAINLVTAVDKASETLIVNAITKTFPEHDILAEEGSATRKDSPYKWIIDPLDGTTNYAHGYPLHCVSIALEYKGQVVLGVVFEPNRDELFTAIKGMGAKLNDKVISASPVVELERAMLATGFAYNVRETLENNLDHFQAMLMKAQAIRRDGVAAIDLCYVACGRYDGFWELNLFPWDVAAGGLILTEAGGRLCRFDGAPYSIYDRDICASNEALQSSMVAVLSPH